MDESVKRRKETSAAGQKIVKCSNHYIQSN